MSATGGNGGGGDHTSGVKGNGKFHTKLSREGGDGVGIGAALARNYSDEDLEPFDRQPGETEKAWEAFQVYRDMEKRSLRKVAQKLGKSRTLIERWNRRDFWRMRIDAWERKLDRDKREELAHGITLMSERHAKEAANISSMLMLPVVALGRRLAKSQAEVMAELEALTAPELLRMITFTANQYPFIARLERLARGEPTDILAGGEKKGSQAGVRSFLEVLQEYGNAIKASARIDGALEGVSTVVPDDAGDNGPSGGEGGPAEADGPGQSVYPDPADDPAGDIPGDNQP